MSKMIVPVGVKEASIEVKVYRAATGKWEDHGVVSYHHRNPLLRLLFHVKRALRKVLPWRRF